MDVKFMVYGMKTINNMPLSEIEIEQREKILAIVKQKINERDHRNPTKNPNPTNCENNYTCKGNCASTTVTTTQTPYWTVGGWTSAYWGCWAWGCTKDNQCLDKCWCDDTDGYKAWGFMQNPIKNIIDLYF